MGTPPIRIVSDLHYADRVSRIRALAQLSPLLEGSSGIVLNGDTLDTRSSKHPEHVERAKREVAEFFGSSPVPVTFLTGNHDPDISERHATEFADGKVLVTHGDVLFDDIVPWSRDAPVIRDRIIAALAALPEGQSSRFEGRIRAFRSVARTIPQLHQSEPNPFRYVVRLAGETVWPPRRVFSILKSWQETPGKAAALAQNHSAGVRFILIGHTHRPGVWRTPSGVVVINTGSFCRPFGGLTAEVTPDRLRVRKVVFRGNAFHPGPKVADFSLS